MSLWRWFDRAWLICRYNGVMDRKEWPTRKLRWNESSDDDELMLLTPGQRMELVYEATRRMLAMQGISLDEQPFSRHIVRVEGR